MGDFFDIFFTFWRAILSLLDNTIFMIDGYQVSLLGILLALLVVSLTISIFWRGARG